MEDGLRVSDQVRSDSDGGTSTEGGRLQASWAFLHGGETPLAQMPTYDVRQAILKRFNDWPHLEASARASKGAMTLIARTPAATRWLEQHMGDVMGLVAGLAQRPMPVEPKLTCPSVRFEGRHVYYIRTLVVARGRKSSPWEHWRMDDLGEEARSEMAKMIEADLSEDLIRWSALGKAERLMGVVVTDVGKPMPIVPDSGPRGLARIGVKFIAPWSIEGDAFAGKHTLMGYGLAKRGGEVGKGFATISGQNQDTFEEENV